jgi:PIN domain nuclease of toxin-antitoxin system
MKLLLDTHTFLWVIDIDTKLSPKSRTLIEDITNEIYISAASLWEMSIKISIGKLVLRQPFDVFIPQQLRLNNIKLLGITVEHLATIVSLPFHHRDPFDRLIIAQSMVEQIPVVSVDAVFDSYKITRIW